MFIFTSKKNRLKTWRFATDSVSITRKTIRGMNVLERKHAEALTSDGFFLFEKAMSRRCQGYGFWLFVSTLLFFLNIFFGFWEDEWSMTMNQSWYIGFLLFVCVCVLNWLSTCEFSVVKITLQHPQSLTFSPLKSDGWKTAFLFGFRWLLLNFRYSTTYLSLPLERIHWSLHWGYSGHWWTNPSWVHALQRTLWTFYQPGLAGAKKYPVFKLTKEIMCRVVTWSF